MAILPLNGSLSYFSIKTPIGRLILTRDKGEAVLAGGMFPTHLAVEHLRDGEVIAQYDLGSGVVTDVGVALMAADWNAATPTLKLINYHDSGTGTTAATVSDTALSVPSGLARVVGAQGNSGNVYSSSAVITYTSSLSIAEWGLFTAPTGGTLWDRRSFTPISVKTNEQLAWSYTLSLLSGG